VVGKRASKKGERKIISVYNACCVCIHARRSSIFYKYEREERGRERKGGRERERERERDLINSFHSTANLGADKKKTLKSQGKKPSTLKSQYADSKNQ
jgi:hypothetical protein